MARRKEDFEMPGIDESVQGALTGGFASYATGQHFGEVEGGKRNEKIRT